MLTAEATLALFIILSISAPAIFWAKKVKLPHTVFLVIIGAFIGIASNISLFSFFKEFTFTPELLFFLLLPTLIFESAYNINIRRMVEDSLIVLILAIIGLLVSTLVIAGALYYLMAFIGLSVPFIVTLIFGALISATDPVAVLALFKEYGAPRRLSLVFEGESLFNDAAAVALFLVLLEVARHGFSGFDTVTEGLISFTSMMVGGAIFGILIGGIFAKLVGYTRNHEVASITLTIGLAHISFVLAEVASHHLHIFGTNLPISPIIATTVAALLMGNYGRAKIHPRAEEFVHKLWEQLAFLSNSIIFILIGVLFVSIPTLDSTMLGIVIATILIVAIARAISIYPVVSIFNFLTSQEKKIPLPWQHLLSWGSLRGAIALIMVFMIPTDLHIAGWNLNITPQEFLLSLTIGCIFATLFIKATTIQWFMKKLHLDELTDIEKVESLEAEALIHHEVTERIKRYTERGYIDNEVAHTLTTEHTKALQAMTTALDTPETLGLSERVLRIFAIGIEKRYLKELYHHDEVSELVYRRLSGKLQIQLEEVERGNLNPNTSIQKDSKDIFETMAGWLRNILKSESEQEKVDNLYMYYRAQTIIARKVLKELVTDDYISTSPLFNKGAVEQVTALYTKFKEQSEAKMQKVAADYPENHKRLSLQLAISGVHKIEEHRLEELFERELITPKVYANLKEELMEKSH